MDFILTFKTCITIFIIGGNKSEIIFFAFCTLWTFNAIIAHYAHKHVISSTNQKYQHQIQYHHFYEGKEHYCMWSKFKVLAYLCRMITHWNILLLDLLVTTWTVLLHNGQSLIVFHLSVGKPVITEFDCLSMQFGFLKACWKFVLHVDFTFLVLHASFLYPFIPKWSHNLWWYINFVIWIVFGCIFAKKAIHTLDLIKKMFK